MSKDHESVALVIYQEWLEKQSLLPHLLKAFERMNPGFRISVDAEASAEEYEKQNQEVWNG